MPTQHVIPPESVNEYHRKLGSKRAYHVVHWPRICSLAASADVWLWANETEISATLLAHEVQEGLTLTFTHGSCNTLYCGSNYAILQT